MDSIGKYLHAFTKNKILLYIRRNPIIYKLPELYAIHILHDENNQKENFLGQEYRVLMQKAIDSWLKKCKEIFCFVFSDKLKHKQQFVRLRDIVKKVVEAHITIAYRHTARYINKEYWNLKTIHKILSIFFQSNRKTKEDYNAVSPVLN